MGKTYTNGLEQSNIIKDKLKNHKPRLVVFLCS